MIEQRRLIAKHKNNKKSVFNTYQSGANAFDFGECLSEPTPRLAVFAVFVNGTDATQFRRQFHAGALQVAQRLLIVLQSCTTHTQSDKRRAQNLVPIHSKTSFTNQQKKRKKYKNKNKNSNPILLLQLKPLLLLLLLWKKTKQNKNKNNEIK